MTSRTRILRLLSACVIGALIATPAAHSASRRAADFPPLDHIIVIVMENKSYDEVRVAPFTASLIADGTSFSHSYAVTHPSQPNYIAMWSAGTQGVTNDACMPAGTFFSTNNLGHACEVAGKTWRAYSEDLPNAGAAVCTWNSALYTRKHDPWTNFINLQHGNERPYSDFLIDVANDSLPNLAFVIPNNTNNTHNSPVSTGDDWLANNVPQMLDVVGGRGMVVLTWDEDDFSADNQILTVFRGPLIAHGLVSERHFTHYTLTRVICDALGITPWGNAALDSSVTDIWLGDSVLAVPRPHAAGRAWLSAPMPNPSTHGASVRLVLATPATIEAEVFDAAGRSVRHIASGLRSGEVTLAWNGQHEDGRAADAGLYFLRVRAGGEQFVRRLALLR